MPYLKRAKQASQPTEHPLNESSVDLMQKLESNVLIIDDDAQLRVMLAELLRLENYAVDTAADGVDGLSVLAKKAYDLVILDVMMPRKNGFETLKRIRKSSSTPVIMLTARGEADDRILGLEHGADDYIAKPFNPRELLLRIKAILKRSHSENSLDDPLLTAGTLEVDTKRLTATLEGKNLVLTGAELRVLEALMRTPGRAVGREALNEFALGRELTPFDRALDTHISNLRGKLKSTDSIGIRSVRGEGYLLVAN